MKILEKVKTSECRLGNVYMDHRSILHVTLYRQIPSKRNLGVLFDLLMKEGETKENLMLVDVSQGLPLIRENRILVDQHLKSIGKKLAFYSSTDMGHMIARLFIQLSETSLSMRVFKDKYEAMDFLLEKE